MHCCVQVVSYWLPNSILTNRQLLVAILTVLVILPLSSFQRECCCCRAGLLLSPRQRAVTPIVARLPPTCVPHNLDAPPYRALPPPLSALLFPMQSWIS